MYGFCWLRVWLVSLFPSDRLRNVVEQFREFERFLPVPFEQLFTFPGRIALTFDELIVVMCIVVWSIARGSDAVSGELGRGTMEMLLAQPLSRLRLLWTQSIVTVGGVAVLCSLTWLGIWTGIHTTSVDESVPLMGTQLLNLVGEAGKIRVPMTMKANAGDFLPAALNLFSLGFFLAGLSTLMSSWDRYRWRTIGIVAGIYAIELIIKIAALASERLSWLMNFTFFAAYEPEHLVSIAVNSPEQTWSLVRYGVSGEWLGWGPLAYCALLLAMGTGCFIGSAFVFTRRDLPAPL
jgi:ABC-2 type transport system permease protein